MTKIRKLYLRKAGTRNPRNPNPGMKTWSIKIGMTNSKLPTKSSLSLHHSRCRTSKAPIRASITSMDSRAATSISPRFAKVTRSYCSPGTWGCLSSTKKGQSIICSNSRVNKRGRQYTRRKRADSPSLRARLITIRITITRLTITVITTITTIMWSL